MEAGPVDEQVGVFVVVLVDGQVEYPEVVLQESRSGEIEVREVLADWEGSEWTGGSDAAEGEVPEAELVCEGAVGEVEGAKTASGGFSVEGYTEAVSEYVRLERVERCFDGARGEEEREQVLWPTRVEYMECDCGEDVWDEAFEGRAVDHGGGVGRGQPWRTYLYGKRTVFAWARC